MEQALGTGYGRVWADQVVIADLGGRTALQALDAGRIDGPRFFTDLFERRPAPQVLRFLDGTTGPVEDLGIMAASPTLPMTATAVADGVSRPRRGAGRRIVPEGIDSSQRRDTID